MYNKFYMIIVLEYLVIGGGGGLLVLWADQTDGNKQERETMCVCEKRENEPCDKRNDIQQSNSNFWCHNELPEDTENTTIHKRSKRCRIQIW